MKQLLEDEMVYIGQLRHCDDHVLLSLRSGMPVICEDRTIMDDMKPSGMYRTVNEVEYPDKEDGMTKVRIVCIRA